MSTPSRIPPRQASIYSLTLEELQNTVNEPGKKFGSMNMEEFLKNIWTVEESQSVTASMPGVEATTTGSTVYPSSSGLQKQGSLSVPKNLTCKTVDEVWKEIHEVANPKGQNSTRLKTKMGKITLEDFLTKAGIVRDEMDVEPSTNSDNSVVTVIGSSSQASQLSSSQADWLNFQLKSNMPHQQLLRYQHQLVHQGQHGNQYPVDAASMAFPEMLVSPVSVGLPSSTISHGFNTPRDLGSNNLSYAVSDRKRLVETHDDQSFDRRQKRMIKNRESAARSRARKQAYTMELESEVKLLKEENAKLFQQQVEMTRQRRKELMEMLVPVTSSIDRPKHYLRRTLSTSW